MYYSCACVEVRLCCAGSGLMREEFEEDARCDREVTFGDTEG